MLWLYSVASNILKHKEVCTLIMCTLITVPWEKATQRSVRISRKTVF